MCICLKQHVYTDNTPDIVDEMPDNNPVQVVVEHDYTIKSSTMHALIPQTVAYSRFNRVQKSHNTGAVFHN